MRENLKEFLHLHDTQELMGVDINRLMEAWLRLSASDLDEVAMLRGAIVVARYAVKWPLPHAVLNNER